MHDFLKRTWANINLDALKHNYREFQKISPGSEVMAVIKADAYGHGAVRSAKVLQSEGAKWFGVSNIEEAIELRRGGIGGSILVLGYTPAEYADSLIEYDISQTVYSFDYASRLCGEAKKRGAKVKVHIKADTGMTRLGFLCQQDVDISRCISEISSVASLEGIFIEGIFTHFPCADSTDPEDIDFTENQYRLFSALISSLKSIGIDSGIRHCCNSAAAILYPHMHLDMVRAGIGMYGLHPSLSTKDKIMIKPVMELKSVISSIKDVDESTYVSYGRTECLCKSKRLAVVAIGYADGYRRCLSSKASILVNGKRAKIVGRVCMDQTIIDITGIDDVQCGQEVTCFGLDHGQCISADELADIEGTINYEIVCLIGKRVTKIYYEDGKVVGSVGLLHDAD